MVRDQWRKKHQIRLHVSGCEKICNLRRRNHHYVEGNVIEIVIGRLNMSPKSPLGNKHFI